jgi:regulatory protein
LKSESLTVSLSVDFSEHKVRKIKLSPTIAEQKIKNWCAYQERSQHETRQKLLEYGLDLEEADLLISKLISENFLNESRFATAFAGGKFRIKHWGKNKIKIELKKHKVSDACIKLALNAIDSDAYEAGIRQVINKKLQQLITQSEKPSVNAAQNKLKHKNYYATFNYLLARGFESDLITEQLKLILKD